MMRVTPKPPSYDAEQVTEHAPPGPDGGPPELIDGSRKVQPGDWVVHYPQGDLYFADDVFHANFDEVT